MDGKESDAMWETWVFIPGLNSMDRGAWWTTVHRVAKNWT